MAKNDLMITKHTNNIIPIYRPKIDEIDQNRPKIQCRTDATTFNDL